jgi:integrase
MHWTDPQGRRKWRKLNVTTLQQARKARAAELVRVERAKVLGFTPPGDQTFAEIGKRFLAHQKARLTEKSYQRECGIVNGHLSRAFSGRIAQIRAIDVQRYVTKRVGEVSTHSVQKELNVLKHMLGLCVEWEIIPGNPSQGVKSPRVPAGRVRYLQPGEFRRILAACPEWLRPIAGLAVATGMRRSEILGLRWLDVDFDNRCITLARTKNGEGRVVYLNLSAIAVLQSVHRGPDSKPAGHVFAGIRPEKVSVAFGRVCRRLEVCDFRFHDLRHTAASLMRMRGQDIHTVASLLGHKDLRMAARYQHLSPQFLADAVASLDPLLGIQCYPSVTGDHQLVEGETASA